MKKILTIVLVVAAITLLLLSGTYARDHKTNVKQLPGKTETLSVVDSVYNFGKIASGVPVSTAFKLANKGSKPIIIQDVATGCGCTTPQWDKRPVMPGKSTVVNVGYNASSAGSFYKSISIRYTGGSTQNIFITGEVVPRIF